MEASKILLGIFWFDLYESHRVLEFVYLIGQDRKARQTAIPYEHAKHLCTYNEADPAMIENANGALAAKGKWESLPWNDRAAIFLKAVDLISEKYRYKRLFWDKERMSGRQELMLLLRYVYLIL